MTDTERECCLCGSTPVVRHHISYFPEQLIDVCYICHSKIHRTEGFHDELDPGRPRPPDFTTWHELDREEEDLDWDNQVPPARDNTELSERGYCPECGDLTVLVSTDSGWYCDECLPPDELANLLREFLPPSYPDLPE